MGRAYDAEAEKANKPQVAERRAWVRYPRRLTVMWQLFGARHGEHWVAEVHDLSLSGIGLMLNRSFQPATVLTIRLKLSPRGPEKTLLVRVKQNTAKDNGEWLVGCTFVVKLSEDDLNALLD